MPACLLSLLAAAALPAAAEAEAPAKVELRVLTDRTASHLDNLFKYYQQAHGVKILTNAVEDGLLERLARRPLEADLVVTKDAELLELARQKELLARFSSQQVIDNVPALFRDPGWYYVVLSFRARALFYAKDRVNPAELGTYRDLAKPKWKGRVCVRSGFHEYNLSWLSQMAVTEGVDATRAFITGLRDNLARPPKGNDREQVRAILEHKCDVAIVNSYYMGIMQQREDQKAWAAAARVFFPDQDGRGAYVMRSGAALTKAQRNVAEATKLLAFLTGDFAQRYFSEALFEHPVKPGVPLAAVNAAMGAEQGIAGGAFKVNLVSLREAVKHRPEVVELLTRANFDRR